MISGLQPDLKNVDRSALISRWSVNQSKLLKMCTYCKKNDYTIDFYWDLHSEKKNAINREESKNPAESYGKVRLV